VVPMRFLPFTSIRLGRDFHPLAAEHARRTTKSPAGLLQAGLFFRAEGNPVRSWTAGLQESQLGRRTPSTKSEKESSRERPDSKSGWT
jgi:hypothetical protein